MKPPENQPSLFGDLETPHPPSSPAAPPATPEPSQLETVSDALETDAPLAAQEEFAPEKPDWAQDHRPAETEENAEGEDEQSLEEADNDLAGWKAELRYDFERWLASLDAIPEPAEDSEPADEAPDLYSFYEQLAAASAESRKANRRTAEAMSQWGDTLARFEQGLGPLRETVAELTASRPQENQMSRAHCLMLVELLDRLHRLTRAFDSPPTRKSFWRGNDAAWRTAWESQRQGLAILTSHLEDWLKQEGVARIATGGQPFDPARMVAIAAEPDASRPAQTVIEESVPGYTRHGELLRAAQVKVSRQAG